MEYPEYPFSALLHHFVIAIFIFTLRLIQISLLQNNCNTLKINCSNEKILSPNILPIPLRLPRDSNIMNNKRNTNMKIERSKDQHY